jgi:hypothetical protein
MSAKPSVAVNSESAWHGDSSRREPTRSPHHAALAISAAPISPLTRDFLLWLAAAPRTYAAAMEAWRTTCPRLSIWEDALADGLIQVESGNGTPLSLAPVRLTLCGEAALSDSRTDV